MSLWGVPQSSPAPRQIRPISRPGASPILVAVLQPGLTAEHWRIQLGGTAAFFGLFAIGIVLAAQIGTLAAIVAVLGGLMATSAGGVALYRRSHRDVVCGPLWQFEGVPITGAACWRTSARLMSWPASPETPWLPQDWPWPELAGSTGSK